MFHQLFLAAAVSPPTLSHTLQRKSSLTLLPFKQLALLPLVHSTPPPQPSPMPSEYEYTEYLASDKCEWTSTSGYGKTNQCVSVTGGLSYNCASSLLLPMSLHSRDSDIDNLVHIVYGFGRGQDYPGDSCSFLLYSGPDCAGTPTSTVPAVSGATSACYQPGASGNSIKLVC